MDGVHAVRAFLKKRDHDSLKLSHGVSVAAGERPIMNFTKLHCSAFAASIFLAVLLVLPSNAMAGAGDFIVGDTGTSTVYRITPGGTKTVLSNAVGAPT